jgi:hypothetical protein
VSTGAEKKLFHGVSPMTSSRWPALAAVLAWTAGCSQGPPPSSSSPGSGTEPAAATATRGNAAQSPDRASPASMLPAVDVTTIQASLGPDETLALVKFDGSSDSRTERGTVDGYATTVWAVPVAAGQTLSVSLVSGSSNLYCNVRDARDASGAAVHRGELDGPEASIVARESTVYLVQPFQPRAVARRGSKSDYRLTITRR